MEDAFSQAFSMFQRYNHEPYYRQGCNHVYTCWQEKYPPDSLNPKR
jgi:endonuclease I